MAGIEENAARSELDHVSGLQALADRHRVSLDAVRHLLGALERGQGRMAQFDHPDLGGMGQWFSGGMVMVGRMFDQDLKARVDALCTELAASLPADAWTAPGRAGDPRGGGEWWPAGLGLPSTSGSQNGRRYAYFPESRRLAIQSETGIDLYDTGDHRISGVSQSSGSLGFTGPQGTIALDRLRRIEAESAAPRQADPAAPASGPASAGRTAPAEAPRSGATSDAQGSDIVATIERLAGLRDKGILTDQEFTSKKVELLARL